MLCRSSANDGGLFYINMSFSKPTQQMINDLSDRKHPFYEEWTDWKQICIRYHSERTKMLQKMINKGVRNVSGEEDITCLENNLIDEVYFQGGKVDSFMDEEGLGNIQQYFYNMYHTTYFKIGLCSCDDYDSEEYRWQFPYITCKNKLWHAKAFLISILWAWVRKVKPCKALRRYYNRLERVILSLNEQIFKFDLELITNPPKYRGRGRSLLKELYERGYFDHFDLNKMIEKCEEIKHARQQSGTQQSEIPEIYDEMIDVFARLTARYPDKDLKECLLPVQQGWISHSHTINDEDLDKLKNLVNDAQKNFFEGFKTTMLSTGKTLIAMFLTASTVALLAKAAITTAGTIVLKLLHFIYSFICGSGYKDKIDYSEVAVQQSGDISIPFIPTIILDYIICPPANILGKIWACKETDNVMRRLAHLPRSTQGMEQLIEWIKDLIHNVKRWYAREVLGEDIPEDINNPSHKLKIWNDEIDKVVKSYYANTFAWSVTNQAYLYNLYANGVEYARTNAYSKWKNDINKNVNKLGNILEIFKQKIGGEGTIRNPPVTIYLTGDTGVGKSSLTYPFAAESTYRILKNEKSEMKIADDWESMIYMRCPEQEYWDRYRRQLVTIFDDYSQRMDTSGNPNVELFEIIRASNCFPYPLHMAALEDKATTMFESKIIIVSSNLDKPDCKSLNFPEALHRRFDLCVRVKRKEGIVLDKKAKFRPDIYTFVRYDMTTGADLGEISYEDLVTLTVCAYMDRNNYVNSISEYIRGRFDELDTEFAEEATEDVAVQQMYTGVKDALLSGVNYIEDSIGSVYRCVRDTVTEWWSSDQIDKAWKGLENSVERMRLNYATIELYWIAFKMDHPYLSNMLMGISLLVTGLMFISVFFKIKNICKPKKPAKVMTPEAFEEAWKNGAWEYPNREYMFEEWEKAGRPRIGPMGILGPDFSVVPGFLPDGPPPQNEAYGTTTVPIAKREAYGEVKAPIAKREAYASTNVKLAKRESTRNDTRLNIDDPLITEQGVKDLNAAEVLMKIARSNLYKLYITSTGMPIGHVMFLKGKVMLLPRHYKSILEAVANKNPDATVFFEAVLLRRAFECKASDVLKSSRCYESPCEKNGPVYSRDLMAAVVPTSIIHSDASPFFCTRSSLSQVDSTSVVLPVLVKNAVNDSERSVLLLRYSEGRSQLKRKEELPVYDDDRKLVRYVRDVWSYNMDTQGSECGAPLIVRNTQIRTGKICGIHVAGIEGTGQGFSTPVYREDVEEILKQFPQETKYVQVFRQELKEYPVEQCQVPTTAEFLRLGAIDKPLPQPGVTKIEPSLAHAAYKEPETKPCLLRPALVNEEVFDPRAYRIGRLGNIPGSIDQELIDFSRDAFADELSQVISQTIDVKNNDTKGVYSFEEAVLGIDGDLYVNSVKRNTSPGFPFVQMNGFKSRQDIFGNGEEYDLNTPQAKEMKRRVEYIIEQAKLGVVLDHYFMDTLKDERKPIHKAHKTRLFAAGPLDYLIACKMYFNGVVALLQRNRNWSHVSVGTNPYSLDWGEIVSTLKRKADNMVAGDFEGFDASQHQRLLEAAGEVLITLAKRFLSITPEDETVMRVLLVSLWNSLHITGKEVYQWTHSLPSGHYLTAIINSLFVNISFGCVWQIAKERTSYLSARSFWELCGIVAYGDDHVVSIPDSELHNFNQLVLGDLFKKIGLSYTLEDKDAVAEKESRDISEVSYLKRNFVRDEKLGRWIAPISLQTILESPMWIHKCPDKKLQTIANLENSIKELSLHDEMTWTYWAPKLVGECNKLGHYTKLVNQAEVRNICLNQDYEV